MGIGTPVLKTLPKSLLRHPIYLTHTTAVMKRLLRMLQRKKKKDKITEPDTPTPRALVWDEGPGYAPNLPIPSADPSTEASSEVRHLPIATGSRLPFSSPDLGDKIPQSRQREMGQRAHVRFLSHGINSRHS